MDKKTGISVIVVVFIFILFMLNQHKLKQEIQGEYACIEAMNLQINAVKNAALSQGYVDLNSAIDQLQPGYQCADAALGKASQ